MNGTSKRHQPVRGHAHHALPLRVELDVDPGGSMLMLDRLSAGTLPARPAVGRRRIVGVGRQPDPQPAAVTQTEESGRLDRVERPAGALMSRSARNRYASAESRSSKVSSRVGVRTAARERTGHAGQRRPGRPRSPAAAAPRAPPPGHRRQQPFPAVVGDPSPGRQRRPGSPPRPWCRPAARTARCPARTARGRRSVDGSSLSGRSCSSRSTRPASTPQCGPRNLYGEHA